MSDIEFNIDKENKYLTQQLDSNYQESGNSGLVNFLVKKGVVKNVRQADIFLSLVVVAMIALSVFIFYFFTGGQKKTLTKQESDFFNSPVNKKTTADYDAALFGN